ncbi:adenosylcobinamide-GDP ribazoletransferase [Gluconacetobacter entanii]|uniref:adenosylcobinamide-GDP ribazoletransferase n=1 Tax=Gluconacetobacter entanii TaxID=108528 RepID=UPI001C932D89|nr:adenosylcobinamide-GDP ribazoletransferase [Gluconacetobacter entanii]MBY4639529.1 adenosylcobinamide-GDP ribazoletransferase [Gluconacetobacter entanii]MCW4579880.1 adenosylcobinamide-GDP ribazoletransferase [Gluconacetobacter entanii]MCW4583325.1 adenosylcobinamide-GDP ribazoletransferase [Gluconacetobacter entanii]MCW4586676.1 adenosylcobinamide-GDP ribazoletransferase [Gluconacetobacter entanii]
MTGVLARLRADIVCGVGLLTRLPVGVLARDGLPYSMTRSVWTWPTIGAVCGLLGAGMFIALSHLRIAPLPAAALAVAAQLLLTGGLHEDGLADMADGFGGGRTRARKLEIMRDSRIGSYGMMALCLALLARVGAISALPAGLALLVLPVAGALARVAMAGVLAVLPPARTDGLASTMARIPLPALAACMLPPLGLAPWLLGAWAGGWAILVTLAMGSAMAALAYRQVGGQTGDVLGAVACLGECVLLAAIPAALA